MSYPETIDYLYRLQWHGIHPGLERMEALLSRVGHPERQFRSVHIGGTNGKGSTAAMVASAFHQGGYRVGLYTSPHLIDFSERIRVSGVLIPPGEIVRLTQFLRERIEAGAPQLRGKITFFEFTTALAFLYFAETRIDLAVVEVGLGGRFDATNVLRPLVSAITNIDLDHEQYLGSTIVRIAEEKAGIIKEGVPVITAAAQPEVLALFETISRLKGAPLIRVGQEIRVSGDLPERFLYQGIRERQVHCPLLGRHQIRNTAVALGVIEQLQQKGIDLSEAALLEGIARVRWEGRLEAIRRDPLILLDGAHNPAGGCALGRFLKEIDPDRKGRHWLIAGILRDKNIGEILSPLIPWIDEIVLTRPDIPRAADPALLSESLNKELLIGWGYYRPPTVSQTIRAPVSEAIAYVEARMRPEDTLVITGSLYTVGEAKAFFSGVVPSLIRG